MTSKERVMLASELHGLLVLPEDVLQGARDLAERRVRLHRLHDRVHEIARGARFVSEARERARHGAPVAVPANRSEEHTSELQSHSDLVCRLLLEKKKNQ